MELGDQFVRSLDGCFRGDLHDLLACETFLVGDLDVDGQNHDVGFLDVLLGQRVFDADGALGFDLDVVARGLGRVFELLLGHVGVCDAYGACADAYDLHDVLL